MEGACIVKFKAKAGQPVILKPQISNITPGVKANFDLYAIANDGSATAIAKQENGTFAVPGGPAATMTTLRLDTTPAFNGATSADVTVPATQGGAALQNSEQAPGHSNDWLSSVTKEGVTDAEHIKISFN